MKLMAVHLSKIGVLSGATSMPAGASKGKLPDDKELILIQLARSP
jgi:hypothetical protein